MRKRDSQSSSGPGLDRRSSVDRSIAPAEWRAIPRPPRKSARRRFIVHAPLLAITLLALVCGCPPPQGGARGPGGRQVIRETPEIIATVQSNAGKVDRALWAGSISVTARFKDDRGKRHTQNLEGTLVFRKPRDLRIDLRPGLGERVMGIGSNESDYWVWIEPEVGVMRWGRHAYSGRPCAERIPVRPDQLATVLGFGGLPDGSEDLLGPTRKFGRGQDILSYSRLAPDGHSLRLDREYFVERTAPFLVRMVVFYDEQGRRVMSALLDDYRAAWSGGPLVAHRLNVAWPRDDGNFTMSTSRIEGRAQVSPQAFVRPSKAELPSGVREIIQVDADCDKHP